MTAPRAGAALLAMLFVGAAALQDNDPDPHAWVAIYLAVALAQARAARPGAPRSPKP